MNMHAQINYNIVAFHYTWLNINTDILNTTEKEQKICYILGDLKIDLFKTEEHPQTSNYWDILYSHSLFPLITKPTRVIGNSATLIDHIFAKIIFSQVTDVTHTQGIICTSIADHYAVSTLLEICMPVRVGVKVKTILFLWNETFKKLLIK